MESFGKFVLVVIGIVITTALRGWVLVQLWGWFVVPGLHAPPITIPMGLGLAVVVSLFAVRPSKEAKERAWSETFGFSVVASLLCLGAGWVYTLFM
jgi:hypothetical protein